MIVSENLICNYCISKRFMSYSSAVVPELLNGSKYLTGMKSKIFAFTTDTQLQLNCFKKNQNYQTLWNFKGKINSSFQQMLVTIKMYVGVSQHKLTYFSWFVMFWHCFPLNTRFAIWSFKYSYILHLKLKPE